MSTKEKLIERFKKLPKDFTFDELDVSGIHNNKQRSNIWIQGWVC